MVVDQGDLVVRAPEEPHPVVLVVAVGRAVGVAVERARGDGYARVALLVGHQVLTAYALEQIRAAVSRGRIDDCSSPRDEQEESTSPRENETNDLEALKVIWA